MWQTILCFFDAHPWFLASLLVIIVLFYKVFKAVTKRMWQIIVQWRQERYDAKVFAAMPSQTIELRPFAKVLKTSRKKLLSSMRRFRDQGRAISIPVDELEEEELWRKI
jgi:hypothetical protein